MPQYEFLFTIIWVAIVGIAWGSIEDVLTAYAKHQLLNSCYGEAAMMDYELRVKEAATECARWSLTEGVRISSFVEDQQQQISASKQLDSTFAKQNPLFSNFNWDDLFDSSKSISIGDRRSIPIPEVSTTSKNNFFMNRKKRQLDGSVTDLKKEVSQKLSNLTCVLRKLNYINDRNQLEFDYMVTETRSLDLPNLLRENIIEGLITCKETATCLPVHATLTTLSVNMQRVVTFMKCFEQKRDLACMKHNLRSQSHNLELHDEITQLRLNLAEVEQTLAIILRHK